MPAMITVNHEEIREWAKQRNAKPTCLRERNPNKNAGKIRLHIPDRSPSEPLEEISWDVFFNAFERHKLAFVYHKSRSGVCSSNFNRIIPRDSINLL